MADKTNNCGSVLGSGNGCARGGSVECGTCICTDKIFDAVKIKECLEDIKVHLTEADKPMKYNNNSHQTFVSSRKPEKHSYCNISCQTSCYDHKWA